MFTIGHFTGQIPSFDTIYMINDCFCQGYGSTTWRIFFLGGMGFFQFDWIVALAIHDFSQKLMQFKKDIDANAEVRSIEKASAFEQSKLFNVGCAVEATGADATYQNSVLP